MGTSGLVQKVAFGRPFLLLSSRLILHRGRKVVGSSGFLRKLLLTYLLPGMFREPWWFGLMFPLLPHLLPVRNLLHLRLSLPPPSLGRATHSGQGGRLSLFCQPCNSCDGRFPVIYPFSIDVLITWSVASVVRVLCFWFCAIGHVVDLRTYCPFGVNTIFFSNFLVCSSNWPG